MNEKKDENSDNPFADAPVIFSYTRAQAIEDGVLVDLSEWAKGTGFKIPVACTSEVWHSYITPPQGTRELGQSERGRAHDVLWMLFVAIKRRPSSRDSDSAGQSGASEQLLYEVIFLQAPHRHKTVELKAICGPGDQGEPVLTIMMPHED
ncbi:MAG: hypothetical protein B6D36_03220 [Planctomycetes bacterium UTPLA1]|jgi:hypothetical protein|nr:MAG: hypothetical protein B6D36_03220 [Planctomycetes bacterium UTPLA1]